MSKAISFQGVCKNYSNSLFKNTFFFRKNNRISILENINFDINKGETFGIVGLNGAGKSTLLKLIAGLTKPTSGKVTVNGNVRSLIELGGSFNNELTGIDNIFIECELLGYTHKKINELIPIISEFSELGDFLDKPLKIFSTGMKMRLAFAISTVEKPDILIIDEALSVGDEYFQHKCYELLKLFKNSGTTIVFVSHDKSAIISLCDRVLLLANKTIYDVGYPKSIMEKYNELISPKDIIKKDVNSIKSFGSFDATFLSYTTSDLNGRNLEYFYTNQTILINISISINEKIEQLVFGFSLKDKFGNIIYGTNTYHTKQILHSLKSSKIISIIVSLKLSIAPGTYSLSLALTDGITHLNNSYHWIENALFIVVVNQNYYFEGISNLDNNINILNT